MFSRPRKKIKRDHARDTVPLGKDEDFFDLSAQEVIVNCQGQAQAQPISPQKHRRDWTSQESWAPEDTREYGLDSVESYEEALNAHVFADELVSHSIPENSNRGEPKKNKKSLLAVCWQRCFSVTHLTEYALCRRDHTNTGENIHNRDSWKNYLGTRDEVKAEVRSRVWIV